MGKDWLLITNDYGRGHDTSAANAQAGRSAMAATIIDEILVPQGTRDFTSVPDQIADDQSGSGRRRRRRRRP